MNREVHKVVKIISIIKVTAVEIKIYLGVASTMKSNRRYRIY